MTEGVGTLLIIIAPEKIIREELKINWFMLKRLNSIKFIKKGIITIPAAAGDGIPINVLLCSLVFSILFVLH